MYLVALATILVFFIMYLLSTYSSHLDVNFNVNVDATKTQEFVSNTQQDECNVNDNASYPEPDIYTQMYAMANPPVTSNNRDTTIKPFEAFDTVGGQSDQTRQLAIMAATSMLSQKQPSPINLECTDEPAPCEESVVWKNTFPGCGSFHIPLESKNYIIDERVWQADLNPKIQERAALLGKEWDPYQHMRARQAYLQFISANFSDKSDPYMEAIEDLDDVNVSCVSEIQPTALA